MTNQETIQQIREKIHSAQRIAIFSHIRPDGDTLGSLFGLGQALRMAGKSVQLISSDPLPKEGWFPGADSAEAAQVQTYPDAFDLSICVDISSRDRAGDFFQDHPEVQPDIVFDHHYSNLGFGKLNYVDDKAASNSEILTELIPQLGLTIDAMSANYLLSGVLTDTQGFSTSNVTPKTLQLAAALVAAGGNLYQLYADVIKAHSLEANALWEAAFRNSQVELPLIWATIPHADRVAAHYPDSDDASVVNRLLSSNGVKVAIVFMESPDGKRTKVSWRAKPGFNVADVATSFGGGGHIAASGADVEMTLNETVEAVVAATKEMIRKAFEGPEN